MTSSNQVGTRYKWYQLAHKSKYKASIFVMRHPIVLSSILGPSEIRKHSDMSSIQIPTKFWVGMQTCKINLQVQSC